MKHYTFICELPGTVQAAMLLDAVKIWNAYGVEITTGLIHHFMGEKIANVIGYEEGLLPAEKYNKYVFGRE